MSSATPETAPTRADRAAWWIAVGLGAGLAPFAPGTFGSLLGLAVAFAAYTLGGAWGVGSAFVAATALGWLTAGRASRVAGRPDPPAVVIDEVAGQLLALVGSALGPRDLVLGFVLFRLFDIGKPWPVSRLEKLPGASGIMADDLAAGLMAAAVAFAVRQVFGLS